jgi:mannose-6-phosphate isomerase-like protein (cupin superfamily)
MHTTSDSAAGSPPAGLAGAAQVLLDRRPLVRRDGTGAVPPDLLAVLDRLAPHPHFATGPAAGSSGHAIAARPTPARLAGIARELASALDRDLDQDGDASTTRLSADAWHEAWLLRWPDGRTTGRHDHSGSMAALCVARGRLELRTTRGGDRTETLQLTPGAVRVIGSSDVHELRNPGGEPAVSIHVYAPRRRLRMIR